MVHKGNQKEHNPCTRTRTSNPNAHTHAHLPYVFFWGGRAPQLHFSRSAHEPENGPRNLSSIPPPTPSHPTSMGLGLGLILSPHTCHARVRRRGAAVGVELHPQGLDVVGAVGAPGEVREVELDPRHRRSQAELLGGRWVWGAKHIITFSS